MLDIPLPQLKRQLEEMLLDLQLLATALKQLRDLLPEHSEKRVTIMTLLGRLNDANKKALRDTLDNTALQTEYNAIRADLSDFIQDLEEADFDASVKTADGASKGLGGKQGSVLYRIPHTMPINLETQRVVRIALDEDAIVEEIVIDSQVVLKDLSRVSDLMQVELADPSREQVFSIRGTSPAQQLITDEGYTEWFFYVEPKKVGTHPLEVKVSVLELALNQVHRKELVFHETIEIFMENAAPADEDRKEAEAAGPQKGSSGFKNAGQAFAFEGTGLGNYEITNTKAAMPDPVASPPKPPSIPSPPKIEEPSHPSTEIKSRSGNTGLRALAFLMAFVVLGSTATWAFTPAETRDWWVASLEDDAQAYESYIEKHPESPYREKAFYFRAERSDRLGDLRAYQQEFRGGRFQDQVVAHIYALETKALDSIRIDPSPEKIRRFARQFPETDRLAQVKQAADQVADARPEVLNEVENIYVASARQQPTEQKVKAYLRDFPKHEHLKEVTEAAAAKPDVMARVQEDLEEAHLQKLAQSPTVKQADEFLDQFPEPLKKQEFEKILEKRPAVKKDVELRMKKAEKIRESAAQNKIKRQN